MDIPNKTVAASDLPARPVVHDPSARTPEQLLGRLTVFNQQIEHITRLESILMRDLGLSKEDADVFIRKGVEAVFGKPQADCSGSAGYLTDPDAASGVWMNELREDFVESKYSIKQTKTVLVSFHGHRILIRKPNRRVVSRLAFYDEKKPDLSSLEFVEEREYELTAADVFLLPLDIPVKLRWLQRFPIAIKLKSLPNGAPIGTQETLLVEGGGEPRFVGKDPSTLFLFARCDREKEELYWKFIKASGKCAFPIRIPPVHLSESMGPLDLMFHRLFGDVLVEPEWKATLNKKIEQKLGQMKKPLYLDELKVIGVDMGKRLPQFGEVSNPRIDRFGVWMELDFELVGPITVSLVTSLNPFKLINKDKENDDGRDKKIVTYDTLSDLYGGYSSDDFEEDTEMPNKEKSKIQRFVESFVESKAFLYFSEIGVVRKELEKVADADLAVTLEVMSIRGRLVVNLPPPPSDRMWYGFLPKPEFNVKVTPRLGSNELTFTMVTDFLEDAVTKQFHQVLTLPNMDDITIPFANSGVDPPEYRLSKLADFVLKYT